MKKFLILLVAALFIIPANDAMAQLSRKKKNITETAREGYNKRLWLKAQDTSWRPSPGGLYMRVYEPEEMATKKGKSAEMPIIEGKNKVRKSNGTYDTIWKFTAFNGKSLYYCDFDYTRFATECDKKAEKREWGNLDPVMDYLLNVSRTPMRMCAVFSINPKVKDEMERRSLVEKAQREALIAMDYFRDMTILDEMKNKIQYYVGEVDYRYWMDNEFYTQEQPEDDIIHVGLILYFGSKKINLFPSPAVNAKTFSDVKFFPNDATIPASYKTMLDELADYLKEQEGLEVMLRGYCDNVGTESYNLGLSRQRAVEVKKALLQRGISEQRIEIEVKGEDDPIGDNNTYEGRIANNRVSVTIQ